MSELVAPQVLEMRVGPVSAVDLALYAGASGDHNPLHLDAEVASAAGFDRPVVHGMLSMAYASRLFASHFGAGALRSLNTRFTGVALRGDHLIFRARWDSGNADTADYLLTAHKEQGGEVLTGRASVRLTPRG